MIMILWLHLGQIFHSFKSGYYLIIAIAQVESIFENISNIYIPFSYELKL